MHDQHVLDYFHVEHMTTGEAVRLLLRRTEGVLAASSVGAEIDDGPPVRPMTFRWLLPSQIFDALAEQADMDGWVDDAGQVWLKVRNARPPANLQPRSQCAVERR